MAVQVIPDESCFSLGESNGKQKSGSSRPHVLVVDDENGPRQALRMLLKEDYEVHIADGAKAGLEIVREEPIELVVTDVRMPKVTGVDLLREVKEINTDVQVIIMTGYGQLETAMKAVEYGAFAYLEKPFDNQVMLDMVRSAQRKFRIERERRTFEKLALEANRFETLGRIVSGTMHDLGTPLTVLSSHIELLLLNPDRDDLTKRLETMKSQVQYCAELSRSTMSYLRHDKSGAAQSLNTILESCFKVARPLLREHQVDLQTHLEPSLSASHCDVVTMRQAAMNIITNACQAMSESKTESRTLHVTTWTEDGHACLSIEDNGPGIPEKEREAVFETFYSTKGEAGTGLGLGVVQTVVHQAEGSVTLEDGRYGSGANFVIRIPIAKDSPDVGNR